MRLILIFTMVFFVNVSQWVVDLHAADSSGFVSVNIQENIDITEMQAMDFGALVLQAGQADTVTLTTDGTLTANTVSRIASSPLKSARFLATGTPNATVSISFNNGTLSGTGSNIILDNFVHNAGATPVFNGSGVLDFFVGADLNINSNQAVGAYSGAYQVTINYQ